MCVCVCVRERERERKRERKRERETAFTPFQRLKMRKNQSANEVLSRRETSYFIAFVSEQLNWRMGREERRGEKWGGAGPSEHQHTHTQRGEFKNNKKSFITE